MWDQRYDRDDYLYGTEPNDYLRRQADLFAEGARVLCLAEGEGRNAVYLAQRSLEVTAVDASAVGLEKARRLARERGVELTTEQADLADYNLGHERWDGIVAIFAHLPPQVRQAVHGQIFGALKPGGLLVLEAYRPEQLDYGTGGPPEAELLISPADLERELGGLWLDELQALERPVHEGAGHSGLAAVVQALGLKV